MTDNKIVSLRGAINIKGTPHKPTIDRLRHWLALAEKGDVVGLCIATAWSTHHVTTDMVYPDGYAHDLHSGVVVMSHRLCANLLENAEVFDDAQD